ncbi:hypothetical protein AAG570_001674 [Ranatra chinensis]|uniref:Uncharacterized protein n=1 Tax=Ranatra chinensis TaxID=642074 RepID=A0ABD0YB57_9HEMI
MASKRRNMFHKNKTQETTEEDGVQAPEEEGIAYEQVSAKAIFSVSYLPTSKSHRLEKRGASCFLMGSLPFVTLTLRKVETSRIIRERSRLLLTQFIFMYRSNHAAKVSPSQPPS